MDTNRQRPGSGEPTLAGVAFYRRVVELQERHRPPGREVTNGLHKCDVLAFCNEGCPKDRIVALPEGQGTLSYRCPAYRRFFRHSRPLLAKLAEHLKARLPPSLFRATPTASIVRSVGPNQPCPCGSGRKYKRCCRP
jgi:uncharacterized protein